MQNIMVSYTAVHNIKLYIINNLKKLKFINNNNLTLLKVNSGVALVAVLAILVVLTILAASFSAMMNLELKQSNEQQNSYQLDMLVNAGLEHTNSLLTEDILGIRRKRFVIELDKTVDGYANVTELEQYSP